MSDGHVLVVDDDDDIRAVFAEILSDHGFHVTTAANGQEALDVLSSLEPRPGVILLDLMMPVMDGRSFREEQLKRAPIADVPVVVMSAHRDASEAVDELGAAAFLKKPMALAELLRVLDPYRK